MESRLLKYSRDNIGPDNASNSSSASNSNNASANGDAGPGGVETALTDSSLQDRELLCMIRSYLERRS